MNKIAAAQQFMTNLVPQVTSKAADILNVFQGGSVGGAPSGADGGLFGAGSLFDSELGKARAQEVGADSNPRRDEALSKPRENQRSDRDIAPQETRGDNRHSQQNIRRDERDDIESATAQESQRDITDKPEDKTAQANKVEDSEATAQAALQDERASKVADEPIGTVEDVLSQAQDLLAKIQEFSESNPQLALQLQAVLVPIQQALEGVIARLGALDPATVLTAQDLGANIQGAFKKLEQLAQFFNQLNGGAITDEQIAGGDLQDVPEGLINAAKALKQGSAQAVNKINEFAAALKQWVQEDVPLSSDGGAVKVTVADSKLQLVSSQSAQQALTTGQLNQEAALQADSIEQMKLDVASQKAQANDNQSNHQNGQQAGQNGQQNLTGNAAQQTQQQAQSSGQSSALTAKADGAATASQPNAASGASSGVTTTAILSKGEASFEQMLKQVNRPPVAEQVQVQIKAMVRNGESKMIVKLDPPELGEVELRLQVMKTSETKVIVTVERQQTLELLQRDSRLLVQALQDAGLKADSGSLSFNLQGGNDSPAGEQQRPKNIYPVAEEQFDEDMLSVVSETHTLEIEQGVNIHA